MLQRNVLADALARANNSSSHSFWCHPEFLDWGHRKGPLAEELLRHDCEILWLCEVDRFEEFYEPTLREAGYDGVFQKKKKSPAADGVDLFWRRDLWAPGLRRVVVLDGSAARSPRPGTSVALLQRLIPVTSSTRQRRSASRSGGHPPQEEGEEGEEQRLHIRLG